MKKINLVEKNLYYIKTEQYIAFLAHLSNKIKKSKTNMRSFDFLVYFYITVFVLFPLFLITSQVA